MKTLKYAARFLIRAKSYTLINLLGLAFSLACCIILMRYIHRELTVDTHCVDRENVYAVIKEEEGHKTLWFDDELGDDSCFIETHAKLVLLEQQYLTYNQELYSADIIVGDHHFFKLFPYRVIQGTDLQNVPNAAVLTKEYAHKLFGDENPIGKILYDSNGKEIAVAGIIEKPNNKCSLTFDIALSQSDKVGTQVNYFRFMPETDMKRMHEIFGETRYSYYDQNPHPYTYHLISLKDLYWNEILGISTLFVKGNRLQLSIVVAICILIGIIGFINFTNLYLLSMQKRRKEYALRKVFGISKGSLFFHLWSESLLLILASLLVAGLLVEITQIPIERILSLPYTYSGFEISIFIGIILLLPLFVCIYPFLRSNYTSPISSIRSIGNERQSVKGRMGYLFVQYVFTFLLVIMTCYLNKQLSLLLHTSPGFRTENIMIAQLGKIWSNVTPEQKENPFFGLNRIQVLMERIKQCPFVEHIEPTSILEPQSQQQIYLNDDGKECELYQYWASPEFFKMYRIPFIEGKLPQAQGDEGWGEYQHIVANREAMKVLGYASRRDGKVITQSAHNGDSNAEASSIIGVVDNHFGNHLTQGVKPTIYQVRGDISYMAMGTYQIAYTLGHLNELIDYIHEVQQDIFGSKDFDYTLLENDIKALYKEDRKVATIYTVFAFIAIAISCLGLFGISLFDIRQRYREIGIRKVNGAKIKDLYRLLFRKYVVVLVAAFVVAIPIAYYLITLYTQDFVVKAPIGIGIFIIALLVVSIISFGTLFWQVHKAANINPADVVKSE